MKGFQCMRLVVCAVVTSVATACTSFSTVRSAQVSRASSFTMQGSVASTPGELAGWFWSLYCVQNCANPIIGVDLAYASGRAIESAQPYSIGGGVNGLFPYVEGYLQLDTARARPYGIGARIGIPWYGWSEHQVYARMDWRVRNRTRLLWNPGIVVHTGGSENGMSRGTFIFVSERHGVKSICHCGDECDVPLAQTVRCDANPFYTSDILRL